MEAYGGFAEVYDLFMDNVDYDAWAEDLLRHLKHYGVESGLIAELGCGTGNLTERLAAAGYHMWGIDLSPDMLAAAEEKRQQSGLDILYLNQDMCELELPCSVDAVICACDGLNYLLTEEELLQVFERVRAVLAPDGVFLFDMNTRAKFREIGETTIAENREEGSFIWENYFEEESGINSYELTLFVRQPDSGLYEKYEETHLQRAYEPALIRQLLERAGLRCDRVWQAFSEEAVSEGTERICFAARMESTAK